MIFNYTCVKVSPQRFHCFYLLDHCFTDKMHRLALKVVILWSQLRPPDKYFSYELRRGLSEKRTFRKAVENIVVRNMSKDVSSIFK